MSVSQSKNRPESICLECGFCCNGVIFADIKLQAEDDVQRLLSLGLSIKCPRQDARPPDEARPGRVKLQQPCAAFDGCRCRIYAERPQSCRQFDCALLQRVKRNDLTRAQALEIIRPAKASAEEVLRLLRQLGDTEESKPLTARFRQTTRRLEKLALDKETAGLYGQLTLAMHELNRVLSEFFYPG